MTADETANYASHRFGRVDDCYRCLDCEVGEWNGTKTRCPA